MLFSFCTQKFESGVGVANEKGQLTSVFSASDVKREKVAKDLFTDMELPVSKFLAKSDRYIREKLDSYSFQVEASDTLFDVLEKVSRTHIHNLFLVDEKQIPLRAYSLCDIISCLI